MAMNARDTEEQLLALCGQAAKGGLASAGAQREANVLRIAAMILSHRFPEETRQLWRVVDAWFDQHPDDLLEVEDIVRRGWVISLPRFRDGLERVFQQGRACD